MSVMMDASPAFWSKVFLRLEDSMGFVHVSTKKKQIKEGLYSPKEKITSRVWNILAD